jgi:hypothetical protein
LTGLVLQVVPDSLSFHTWCSSHVRRLNHILFPATYIYVYLKLEIECWKLCLV